MTIKTAFPATTSPRALVTRVPTWGWILAAALVIYAIVSSLILSAYPEASVQVRLTFEPLLNATLPIQVHVVSALSAFFIGLGILLAPKGVRIHRTLGWLWVVAMAITGLSSFFITGIFENAYSPIHALSAWTLIGLPFGIAAARRRKIKAHRQQMTGLFLGAMVVAGLFTFLPGRLMWQLFFTI